MQLTYCTRLAHWAGFGTISIFTFTYNNAFGAVISRIFFFVAIVASALVWSCTASVYARTITNWFTCEIASFCQFVTFQTGTDIRRCTIL